MAGRIAQKTLKYLELILQFISVPTNAAESALRAAVTEELLTFLARLITSIKKRVYMLF